MAVLHGFPCYSGTRHISFFAEKFGNRDYLLAIETASMDEDAEYSVLAKNIAGEVRSSAQLIVEPKNKPGKSSGFEFGIYFPFVYYTGGKPRNYHKIVLT